MRKKPSTPGDLAHVHECVCCSKQWDCKRQHPKGERPHFAFHDTCAQELSKGLKPSVSGDIAILVQLLPHAQDRLALTFGKQRAESTKLFEQLLGKLSPAQARKTARDRAAVVYHLKVLDGMRWNIAAKAAMKAVPAAGFSSIGALKKFASVNGNRLGYSSRS